MSGRGVGVGIRDMLLIITRICVIYYCELKIYADFGGQETDFGHVLPGDGFWALVVGLYAERSEATPPPCEIVTVVSKSNKRNTLQQA